MTRRNPAVVLPLIIALACVAMLAGALLFQHVLGWEPCTLCVQIRLWLSLGAILAVLLSGAAALKQNWLGFALWPLLLATSAMAVVDNAHVVLIEVGIMESFSCSPFPFYSSYLPLHEYLPSLFMSGGICGQNDYAILGIPFTAWTLISVVGLFLFTLYSLWRAIRSARS
ncbi:disulfide bond formation protein B [Aquipseudomonas ullengensis]|uniref:Disulfide bond formation protein B n=1 Tax=Aquipseudomonas ullengensis TaxID=2759166 RepID=A0A7W4LMQ8_9GAMM|nr:disulfide bond formation protein B [Pseudomonas ullengensis]MBB2496011.1 disulfide bond formation protein B [Pseudomonas ullengensis]